MYFVDPGTGTLRDVPWLTFAAQFEATVARTPVPYPQVFHWPAAYRGFAHASGARGYS